LSGLKGAQNKKTIEQLAAGAKIRGQRNVFVNLIDLVPLYSAVSTSPQTFSLVQPEVGMSPGIGLGMIMNATFYVRSRYDL
jgi:hypothetical protein